MIVFQIKSALISVIASDIEIIECKVPSEGVEIEKAAQ
jgi:hypothetical protein